MSSNNDKASPSFGANSADAARYVVVTTTYPTTYGCNRGTSWTPAEMIARSDVSATSSFATRNEAIEEARRIRNTSCYFQDSCEPDPDNHSEEELAEYATGDYMFTNSDEPPYDSAVGRSR